MGRWNACGQTCSLSLRRVWWVEFGISPVLAHPLWGTLGNGGMCLGPHNLGDLSCSRAGGACGHINKSRQEGAINTKIWCRGPGRSGFLKLASSLGTEFATRGPWIAHLMLTTSRLFRELSPSSGGCGRTLRKLVAPYPEKGVSLWKSWPGGERRGESDGISGKATYWWRSLRQWTCV